MLDVLTVAGGVCVAALSLGCVLAVSARLSVRLKRRAI